VLTIPELIGRQADIARFDIACIVANGEVSEDVIFKQFPQLPQHTYTSDRTHALVMWAWSRLPGDIRILSESEQEIVVQSKRLAAKYHDSIPLIKLEELPEKFARLSVALAARLYSSPDGHSLVVLPEHVVTIGSFIDRLYSKPSMGYDQYSRKLLEAGSIENETMVIDKIKPYGKEFVSGILTYDIIRQNIIEDLTGLEREGVRSFISFLVRSRALRPEYAWYRKTPAFIKMLKKMDTGKIHVEYREEF